MKVETWSKTEQLSIAYPGKVVTEFKFGTFDNIMETKKFVEYIEAYNDQIADVDVAQLLINKERDENVHDFWRGHSPSQIIDILNSIFLSPDKTKLAAKPIELKLPFTWEKINVGIEILRVHYGIFYKPEPEPLQPIEEYDRDPWPCTGIHNLPDE